MSNMQSSQSIKIGDVVRLRSSGPWMTVYGFEQKDYNLATCVWFKGYDLHSENFPVEALEIKEP